MAKAPVFKTPRTTPPASGWKAQARPPACGYGQLDGNCIGDDDRANCAPELGWRNELDDDGHIVPREQSLANFPAPMVQRGNYAK